MGEQELSQFQLRKSLQKLLFSSLRIVIISDSQQRLQIYSLIKGKVINEKQRRWSLTSVVSEGYAQL